MQRTNAAFSNRAFLEWRSFDLSLSLSLSLSLPLSLGERSKEDREEREGIRERQTGKYYLIKFIFT